jgi:hypothetical protein
MHEYTKLIAVVETMTVENGMKSSVYAVEAHLIAEK